jgi:hypothetical protein
MGNRIKISALNTDVILIKKCCVKNNIKSPERAIATFFIDDSIIQILP